MVFPRRATLELVERRPRRIDAEPCRERTAKTRVTDHLHDHVGIVLRPPVRICKRPWQRATSGLDHRSRPFDFGLRTFGAKPREDGMAYRVSAHAEPQTQ